SDIFSLGIVIYEMTAGRVPFDGSTTSDVIVSILEKEPAPLAQSAPGAPSELERIVKKALAKDRDRRYETAGDLLIDLKNLKQEIELQARLNAAEADTKDIASTTTSEFGVSVAAGEQLTTRTNGAVAERTVSSAEYLTNQIKKHKRTV